MADTASRNSSAAFPSSHILCSTAGAGAAVMSGTCACAPTSHPGSFRCSLHRGIPRRSPAHANGAACRDDIRRLAMVNSLLRIGAVKCGWLRRGLTAIIRPSSNQRRRKATFQPRPSRLSVMSSASDDL